MRAARRTHHHQRRHQRGERRLGALRAGALLALLAASPACVSGWLVTHITEPIVTNADNTPRGSRMVEISTHELKVRNITWAEVSSRAIGDAAKRYGMHTVHFADMHTFSIFGGLYRRRSVQVWGE